MTRAYTPTKRIVAVEGFAPLAVTYAPLPLHHMAAAEVRVKNAAKRAAKAECQRRGLKADATGDAAEEYAAAYAEVFGSEHFQERAKVVAKQLVGWDLLRCGQPVPADADGVLSLPFPVFSALERVILGYAAGTEVTTDAGK